MGKLKKLFCGIFLMGTLLISCNKDDDYAQKNYLKIGDAEYALTEGAMENYGMDEDEEGDLSYNGYNIDLTLFSSGLRTEIDEDGYMDVLGLGHVIYFEMFSSKGNVFDSREYSFSSANELPVGTFDDAVLSINYSNKDAVHDWIYITAGKVTISRSGSEYSISINCTGENGESVTGFFKGSLQYYDYTVETKSASVKSSKTSRSKK